MTFKKIENIMIYKKDISQKLISQTVDKGSLL